jgi:hypothetical protein
MAKIVGNIKTAIKILERAVEVLKGDGGRPLDDIKGGVEMLIKDALSILKEDRENRIIILVKEALKAICMAISIIIFFYGLMHPKERFEFICGGFVLYIIAAVYDIIDKTKAGR